MRTISTLLRVFRPRPRVQCRMLTPAIAGIALFLLLAGCNRPKEPLKPNLPGEEDGLVFDTPAATWDEAFPLGNGIMGALLWGDGQPLRLSLDRSDLWDLRPVPEFSSENYNFDTMRRLHLEGNTQELIRLYEEPYHRPAPTKIPAGRIELVPHTAALHFKQARLSLADAVAKVSFREGSTFECFLHAREPVGLMRWTGNEEIEPRLVPPRFGGAIRERASGSITAGDLAQLGYPAPREEQGTGWMGFRQEGAEGFRFAIYLAWSRKGNEWFGAWSIASSFEGEDPFVLARERVEESLQAGWAPLFEAHREWWRGYWGRSTIRLPNPLLERQWFLEQYKFGSASRRNAPPISLQAVWTADNGGLPPWKGDYHHDLNTQLSYWPSYGANHLEEGLSYLDWLWDTREAAFEWTHRFFKKPGLNVPMTADLKGRQIGGWRQYTHSATTAAWLSHHFYLQWRYSRDRGFLEQRAYPYLKDAAVFLEAFTSGRSADGLRKFPLSASPEINDNRPDAWFSEVTNYDLALTRWLFAATAELALEMGLESEAKHWTQTLSELPSLAIGPEGLLVAPEYPLQESHRHFSHLMAIHPLGLLDWSDGPETRKVISASLDHLDRLGTSLWTGYSFAWLASLAARAQDGARAEEALRIFSTAFTLRNSFHCNGDQSKKGYSRFTYRPFTLEGNFAAAAAIQEMLLQSQRGVLRVFPAIPKSWQEVEFTTLRTEGAFLVSATLSKGRVTRLEIYSEKGGPVRLISPFIQEEITLQTKPGENIVLKPEEDS